MGPDSLFHRALDKFSDVAVVSAVTVLCCVLVVPAGRALRASTRVFLMDPAHAIREYFSELRKPAGRLAVWWILVVALHVFAIFEWILIENMVVRAGLISGMLIIYGVSVWFVPLAATVDDRSGELAKLAVAYFVSQPLRTFSCVIVVIVAIAVFVVLLPHSLFFGFLVFGIGQYVVTIIISPPLGYTNK